MTARYCPQTRASGAGAALLRESSTNKEGALNAPVLPAGRFVALDVHEAYLVVAAVDATQQIVLHPKRVLLAEFAAWCRQHLRPTDQVVLEATLNTWQLYDQLVPLVAMVTVWCPSWRWSPWRTRSRSS